MSMCFCSSGASAGRVRAQKFRQAIGEDASEDRRAHRQSRQLISGAFAVVHEIFQAQAKAERAVGENDAAELVEIGGLAVSGQAHDFEFVAKLPEAEVLRDGRVVHAEGMREGDRALDIHVRACAGAPHGAGKIAEAVGGEQRGLIERRNVESAGEVRAMMLDAMELRARGS